MAALSVPLSGLQPPLCQHGRRAQALSQEGAHAFSTNRPACMAALLTPGLRARAQHSEWLRGLGPGVALFSQVALPFGHALTPVVERKAEGERGVDETGEPDDESDVQHEGLGPPVPATRPDTKRSRAATTASRARSGSCSSSASTMQRDSSAGTGKRKGSTRAHGSSREDN